MHVDSGCVTAGVMAHLRDVEAKYGSVLTEPTRLLQCGPADVVAVSHDLATCLRLTTLCAPRLPGGDAGNALQFVLSVCGGILGACNALGNAGNGGAVGVDTAREVRAYADRNGKLAYNCLSVFTIKIRTAGQEQGSAGGLGGSDLLNQPPILAVSEATLEAAVKAFELRTQQQQQQQQQRGAVSDGVVVAAAGTLSSFGAVLQPSFEWLTARPSLGRLVSMLGAILAGCPERAVGGVWVFLCEALMRGTKARGQGGQGQGMGGQGKEAQAQAQLAQLVAMLVGVLEEAGRERGGEGRGGPAKAAATALAAVVRCFGHAKKDTRQWLQAQIAPALRPEVGPAVITAALDALGPVLPETVIVQRVDELLTFYAQRKELSDDAGASLIELFTLVLRRPGVSFQALARRILGALPQMGGALAEDEVLLIAARILRYHHKALRDLVGTLAHMLVRHLGGPQHVHRASLDELRKLQESTRVMQHVAPELIQEVVYALIRLLSARMDLCDPACELLWVIRDMNSQLFAFLPHNQTQHRSEFMYGLMGYLNDQAFFNKTTNNVQ